MLAALLGLFLLPNTLFSLIVSVILLIGLHEWSVMAKQSLERFILAAVLFSLLVCVSFYTALPSFWVIASGVLYWLWQTITLGKPASTPSSWNLIKGVFALWVAWMAFTNLHAIDPSLLLLPLLMVWSADSLAYFGGKRFGRTKLAPSISPGKTWEGVVSGVLGSVIVSIVYCAFIIPQVRSFSQYVFVAVLAILVSLISVVGDLSESKLKRAAEMKDSGSLIPGHGGVLDRVDGLIAGLPLFALCWPLIILVA